MTWNEAFHAISDPDGFMASKDPFYVPSKSNEIVSFMGAASAGFLVPLAPFFVPLTAENLAVVGLAGLIASFMLYQGLKIRKYRLHRVGEVAALRTRLLSERPASARRS